MNNTISQSKMLKILSENAIAQSVDHLEDLESKDVNLPSTQSSNSDSLENEMGKYAGNVADYTSKSKAGLAKSVAKGVGKGIVKNTAKKAAAKAIIEAMKKYGIKSIPLLGSVKAFLDIFVSAGLFLKNMTEFTHLLIEKTGVEPDGLSSILGEHFFTELSGSELKKIADALESGVVSPEDMDKLWNEYKEPQRDFKDLLINICLTFKELSAGLGLAGAIALSVIPVEAGLRELLNFTGKQTHDFINNSDDRGIAMKIIIMYASTLSALSYLVPFIGWIMDVDRRYQWGRIDDALSNHVKSSARNLALDTVGDVAYGATDVGFTIARAADELGDDIAKAIASGPLLEGNNKKGVDLNRWQKLSGIS
jgi:hypothetical protein